MGNSVWRMYFLVGLLCASSFAFSQVNKYPYIKDSSAIAIDARIVALLCKNEWQLVQLRETLRGEERMLNLSSVVKYNLDSSCVVSGMKGRYAIEDSFFLKHFDVTPKNGTNKPIIDGLYFISLINEREMILTKYSTSSLDWRKKYIFKKRGSI